MIIKEKKEIKRKQIDRRNFLQRKNLKNKGKNKEIRKEISKNTKKEQIMISKETSRLKTGKWRKEINI